jgi:hypothetical protein
VFETDLRDYLIAYTDLNALVGSRIYPAVLPDNPTYPAIAHSEVSGSRRHNINVAFPRYQFSCFSPTYLIAKEVATQVRKALQRYSGLMGSTRVIQGVFENEIEFYDPTEKVWNVAVDMKMIIREV